MLIISINVIIIIIISNKSSIIHTGFSSSSLTLHLSI